MGHRCVMQATNLLTMHSGMPCNLPTETAKLARTLGKAGEIGLCYKSKSWLVPVDGQGTSLWRLSVAGFCERIGVSDKNPKKLERGDSGVRVEALAMALLVLEMLDRLRELVDVTTDETRLNLARPQSR